MLCAAVSARVRGTFTSPSRTLLRERGMFPELNNLLNASPDRAEPVTRARSGGAAPGAGRKHASRVQGPRTRGKDALCTGRLCLGVVVQGGPTGLGRDLRTRGRRASAPSRGFSQAVGARERSGKHVRRLGGRVPGALGVLTRVGVPAPRAGCLSGEESLVLHLHRAQLLPRPACPGSGAPAGRGDRCCSSDASLSWCLEARFPAALSQRGVVPRPPLAPQPRHCVSHSSRLLGHLEIFHLLAQGVTSPRNIPGLFHNLCLRNEMSSSSSQPRGLCDPLVPGKSVFDRSLWIS